MNIKTVGIALTKNIFQIHCVDERGKEVLNKRLSRSQLANFIVKIPSCIIGMEACGGAN